MSSKTSQRERIQILLTYWGLGHQHQLCVPLSIASAVDYQEALVQFNSSNRQSKSDAEKKIKPWASSVSKILGNGLPSSVLGVISEYLTGHANSTEYSAPPSDLASALEGSDAQFFYFLTKYGPGVGDLVDKRDKAGEGDRPIAPPIQDLGEDSLIGLPRNVLQGHLQRAFPTIMGGEDWISATEKSAAPKKTVVKCGFLYRLGMKAAPNNSDKHFEHGKDSLKHKLDSLNLVLRRIPARFEFDPQVPHRLRYFEDYEDRFFIDRRTQKPTRFEADAYAYAFENFLTVFSKDKEPRVAQRLSLMHLDWTQARQADDDYVPGVVAMQADTRPTLNDVLPTAYRVLFRVAPGEQTWNNVRSKSATIELKDSNEDGIINLSDTAHWGGEDDIPGAQAREWSWYFNRLNVIRNPIDLLVARKTVYRPKSL